MLGNDCRPGLPRCGGIVMLCRLAFLALVVYSMVSIVSVQVRGDSSDLAMDSLISSLSLTTTTTTTSSRFRTPLKEQQQSPTLDKSNDYRDTMSTSTTRTTTTLSPIPKVSRIYLLGERNSGTNYVEEALFRAFRSYSRWNSDTKIDLNQKKKQNVQEFLRQGRNLPGKRPRVKRKKLANPFSNDIPVFQSKHMFRQTLLNETEYQTLVQYFRGHSNNDNQPRSSRALFVLVVRSPCEWADAMRRKPWHLCPTQPFGAQQQNQGNNENMDEYTEDELCHGSPYIMMQAQPETQTMSLEDFARQPWKEWAIHNIHYLNHHKQQAPQNDVVRPHTPGHYMPPFDHIFQLRTFKLQLMAQVIQAAQEAVTSFRHEMALPIVLIHLRDFEAAPHRTIMEVSERHGLTLEPYYQPLSPTSHELHQYQCISPTMAEWIHGGGSKMVVNWTLEQEHFGFVPSQECQPCAADVPLS